MNVRIKKFFFGFLTFVIICNLVFSNKEYGDENYNNYKATFNKIDGVNVGTDVVISGIKVGYVKKVMINDNFPEISLLVEKDINISDDSSISIQTDGLFGRKFLIIEIGGSNKYLKDGGYFSFAEDSIVIEELLQKIIEIGERNKEL